MTGSVSREQVGGVLETFNAPLPHYKRIRAFYLQPEPFSVENGLLTANGKLRREAVAERLKEQIEEIYRMLKS